LPKVEAEQPWVLIKTLNSYATATKSENYDNAYCEIEGYGKVGELTNCNLYYSLDGTIKEDSIVLDFDRYNYKIVFGGTGNDSTINYNNSTKKRWPPFEETLYDYQIKDFYDTTNKPDDFRFYARVLVECVYGHPTNDNSTAYLKIYCQLKNENPSLTLTQPSANSPLQALYDSRKEAV